VVKLKPDEREGGEWRERGTEGLRLIKAFLFRFF
jgi:hypothetical protein